MMKFWTATLILLIKYSLALSQESESRVVVLANNNFTSVMSSSNKFWVIKYYIPWCGYCIRFAPVFTALAEAAKDWDFVGFGEISCPSSTELCSSHKAKKTPDVKLLIPYPDHIELRGIMPINEGNMLDKLQINLLNELSDIQQTTSIGPEMLPLLAEVRDFADIQRNKGEEVSMIFLIVEPTGDTSSIGQLVIADTFKYRKTLRVFRTSVANAQENLNVFKSGLYHFSNNGTFLNMNAEFARKALKNAIILAAGGAGEDGSNEPSDEGQSSEPRVTDKTYIYRKAHGLHIADLLTNLRYSLWVEVPMVASLDKKMHSALKKYLHILTLYHPADPHVIKFLRLLYEWMEEHPAPITSKEWIQALTTLEGPEAFIPSNTTWVGCRGSEEHLRGYPCSLWMTFHTLTVRAHMEHEALTTSTTKDDVDKLGMDMLLTIRGFIEHFFSCSECSKNFVYYTGSWLKQMNEKWPPKRAVLELWNRHNSVNSRLHLQPITEDPNHPKIQFPAVQDCRECRTPVPDPFSVFVSDPSDWNDENVFKFLVGYYGRSKASSCAEKGKMVFRGKWSTCSKTCDTGVSLRLTNDNEECDLRMETRICHERPCTLRFPDWSRSVWHRAHCSSYGHTYRLSNTVTLQFNNCTSKNAEKLKVCGICPSRASGGRPVCCKPSVSRTDFLDFHCSPSVDEVVEEDKDGVWLNNRNGNNVVHVDGKMAFEIVELCDCSEENCSRT